MLGLDSHIASPVSGTMIDREIDGPIAWTGATLVSGEGSARLGPECLAELMAVAALLRANPLPVPVLDPEDFDLAHCRSARG